MANPYTPLRAARMAAPPNAEADDPPAPITLTAENCEAPVNTSNDITHVCGTDAPALTELTPKEIANTPTAKLRVIQALTTCRMR